jgi:hypothetical protein
LGLLLCCEGKLRASSSIVAPIFAVCQEGRMRMLGMAEMFNPKTDF